MTPFIARDDKGHTVLVLEFVVLGSEVAAVVAEPRGGGRVWTLPLAVIRDPIPNMEWPLGWRFPDGVEEGSPQP